MVVCALCLISLWRVGFFRTVCGVKVVSESLWSCDHWESFVLVCREKMCLLLVQALAVCSSIS